MRAELEKILQDLKDAMQFEIKKYLPLLDYVENPNNEDIKMLRKYNQIFQNLYRNPSALTIEDSCEMWIKLGIGFNMAEKVKVKTVEYSTNKQIMNQLGRIYPEMLLRVRSEAPFKIR